MDIWYLVRYKVNLWCVYLWCVRAYGVNLYGVMVCVCMECVSVWCECVVVGDDSSLNGEWVSLVSLMKASYSLTHSLTR